MSGGSTGFIAVWVERNRSLKVVEKVFGTIALHDYFATVFFIYLLLNHIYNLILVSKLCQVVIKFLETV